MQPVDGASGDHGRDRDPRQRRGETAGPPAGRPGRRHRGGSLASMGLRVGAASASAASAASAPAVSPASSAAGPIKVGCLLDLGPHLGLLQPEGDDRDVVSAAGFVRLADEARDGVVEAVGAGQCGRDPILPEHRRQAVGTQQVHVPRPCLVGHRVHLDLALGPQRPGDDRALRMVLGLLVGEAALAAELLDQGVVGREQLQLAVAKQVGATVAHVGEAHLVILDQRRGQRRPHSRARGVGLGQAVDAGVGRPGDRPQVGLRGLLAALHRLERLGRQPRGHLAGLRAAHSVSYGEQRRAREVRSSLAFRWRPVSVR